ncbi:YiiX/YebB-like N1pC/P60 family cysteine hydrolase [uncultured Polaribacter sp.]|uniref:YiiX/YebB-like N1pC/P60 family cysteine hydrolase n=1 Tax=uncultured Polaribacter sp. TaxID=174711 RepID=UPI002601FA1D|nr:YiiX/YebB-like N1pC/P60 family cysteine hydrolase [uncultured Polaribacter sp.]
MLRQTYLYFICFFVLISCSTNSSKTSFTLKQGDLMFQNTGSDELDNAIKTVTATSSAKNYSHVGMAIQKDNNWFVLEAIPKKGICITPLSQFLDRNKNQFNKSKTTVARLNTKYTPYIDKAIAYGLERLNTPYDEVFLWDDNAYYCSELVYKMFSSQELSKDKNPFLTHAMTFNDSAGKPMASWVEYYKKRNQPIPEGIEGTNPNLMASSAHITFVHDYEKE